MHISNIPTHLFLVIRDFVFLPDSYQNRYSLLDELEFFSDRKTASPLYWRNFVNANKRDFSEIKRLTAYYDLRGEVCGKIFGTGSVSGLFGSMNTALTSSVDLERIRNLPVSNINQQLSLNFVLKARSLPANFSPETTNTEQVPFNCERLTIELQEMGNANSAGIFGGGGGFGGGAQPGGFETIVQNLLPSNELSISLKNFPSVKNLKIWSNLGIDSNEARMLKIYTDSSMQLHSFVTNIRCKFVDQETHSQIFEHLTVCRLPLPTSLSDTRLTFGFVKRLDLSFSKKLRDVSSLAHVHTLNLRGCEQLEDVSMLGDVYSLNINDCPHILSINSLGKVKKLSIKGLKGLRDGLPVDNEVKELWVDGDSYLSAGVSEFTDRNKRINIDLSSLSFNVRPRLSPIYSHIPFAKLLISGMDLQANCDLTGIRELVMEQCKLPAEFTPMMFLELRRLLLLNCKGVRRIAFDRLPALKVLKIDGCAELKSVNVESELEVLELFHQALVENLTIRAAVKTLIINSSSLKILDVTAPVDVFKVAGCRIFYKQYF